MQHADDRQACTHDLEKSVTSHQPLASTFLGLKPTIMPPPQSWFDPSESWSQCCWQSLEQYPDQVLRGVAVRLTGRQQRQERMALVQTITAAQTNPPLIDRCLRRVRPETVLLLTLMARSRQPVWKARELLTLLAALQVHDGPWVLKEAMEYGLIFPYPALRPGTELTPEAIQRQSKPIPVPTANEFVLDNSPSGALTATPDFTPWLEVMGGVVPEVFLHPAVGERVRQRPLPVPRYSGPSEAPADVFRSDGWDWPLRLAAVWQRVRHNPVRLTQEGEFYKKDSQRLQGDSIFAEGWETGITPADAALLTLSAAVSTGLLQRQGEMLRPAAFPACWRLPLPRLLVELLPRLLSITTWDPLEGHRPAMAPETATTSTAGWLILWLLAEAEPQAWIDPAELAAWLWAHHPYWSGTLSEAEAATGGHLWVNSWLYAVPIPLQIVETWQGRVRLTPLGRWYFQGGGDVPALTAPPFPQTLLVQPNAEIIVYRQGLTPSLAAELTGFAQWKRIGPACVLELQEACLHQALESDWTLTQIVQTLQHHASRPVPATVVDLLERWGNRRERFTLFSSAVVVEFVNAADLETALAQGWIRWRLGERFGLTVDGSEPDLRHFRLLANRNYEEPPQQCLQVEEDGLTVAVDPVAADLFIDLELSRVAEPLPSTEADSPRRYRLTAERLRRAAEVLSLEGLDAWWTSRSGASLPPIARLLIQGPHWPAPRAETLLVLRLPVPEAADALLQWPPARRLISERLGPLALAIAPENLSPLSDLLAQWGITLLMPESSERTTQPPSSTTS